MSNTLPTLNLIEDNISSSLTIEEAKEFLRIKDDSNNDLLHKIISTAEKSCENNIKKPLITKKYEYSIYLPYKLEIVLPFAKNVNIDEINVLKNSKNKALIMENNYSFDDINNTITLQNIENYYRVDIIYSSGFGETSDLIPNDLKQAMLFHINKMYDDRNGYSVIPRGSLNIYKKYRSLRI